MKKIALILATFCLVIFTNATAQDDTNPNAPVIQFDSDIVDYGTIQKGGEPLRKIKFTNTGKSPLVITNCQGSCGCTVPTCPKDPIMPGESGELEIRYDTNRVGAINKTVTVKSNASNGTIYIKVKGKIEGDKVVDEFPSK